MRAFHRFALGAVLALAASTAACVSVDTSDRDRPPPSPPATADLAPDQVAEFPFRTADRRCGSATGRSRAETPRPYRHPGYGGRGGARRGKPCTRRASGVRAAGSDEPVDADTVFQLASMSKPVGATVVAQQVGEGSIGWDTPVIEHLPTFALADPYVTEHATVGDLYAHRSGLPDHAGDDLEDLGYDRAQVIERLRFLPPVTVPDHLRLHEFRCDGCSAVGRGRGR